MNDYEKNIRDLKFTAKALGELVTDFIFIGGATVGLYVTMEGSSDVRPTVDIDILTETFLLSEYEELENKLRKKKFYNDTESDVICRWRFEHLAIDIMYPNPKKFGFVNQWYAQGIERAIIYKLEEDIAIKIFSPIDFIATKIVAQRDRGENYMYDNDFADIAYILGTRPIFEQELIEDDSPAQQYIIDYFKEIVNEDRYHDGVHAISTDIGGDSGVEFVIELIEKVAAMK